MFLIIHNPLSNNRKSKKTTNKMVKFFKRHHIPFNLRSSLKIESLTDYLDKNPSITDILFLGGDGSINYLINSVDIRKIKQNIYLAKSGSGNDFLRSLKKTSASSVTIGQARMNGDRSTYFINGSGIGIDASVCHYVNIDTKKSKLSYFINVFRAVSHYKRNPMDVIVDGKEYHFHDCYFVAIQNGKYFGGGMKVAPNANIHDDRYVVCVAHNLNGFLLQLLFLSIYPGFHTSLKKWITMLSGKEIIVKSPDTKYMQADGEVIDDVNTLSVTKAFSKTFIAFNKAKIKKEYALKK